MQPLKAIIGLVCVLVAFSACEIPPNGADGNLPAVPDECGLTCPADAVYVPLPEAEAACNATSEDAATLTTANGATVDGHCLRSETCTIFCANAVACPPGTTLVVTDTKVECAPSDTAND